MKKTVEKVRTHLIQIMSDGQFHSGEQLGEHVDLTRSAIANHMKRLSDLGIEVFSVKGRGYKLAKPMNLLAEEQILLQSNSLKSELLKVANITGSTNDDVKALLPNILQGYTCVAECQTKGRGRRGRTWVSPYGASIYMTMAWCFSGGYQSMAGLSLLVGIAVNRCLAAIGVTNSQLKWPNDVYVDNKKLAGILIEVEGQVGADTYAVIGLGINVELPVLDDQIDQPYTDLNTACHTCPDRNRLIAMIADELMHTLPLFEQKGLSPFLSEWQQADLFYNKKVKLISGNTSITGVSKGINESGALLLQSDGKLTAHYGGEISVREAI